MSGPSGWEPATQGERLFQALSAERAEEFREWARENFKPGEEPNPVWHPVVRLEWDRLKAEGNR